MPGLTVSQLAAFCNGDVSGDGQRVISGANTIEEAGPREISFVANQKAIASAKVSNAGCLIVSAGFSDAPRSALIVVEQPRAAFAQVLNRLYPTAAPTSARHPTAFVSPSASIGRDVLIAAFACIEDGAVIGDNCRIGSHVSIGESASLGPGSTLHPHVVLYPGTQVGARAILHSGCVLGADGFGFVRSKSKYEKFPQVGRVVLGDDVEIGANACIDRAALGTTYIGDGTKLDNLVHIAHNCKVGAHVVIAAQTGFSGGVTVGDGAVIGGQVGVGDGATIAAGAVVGSQAGILPKKHVPFGEPVWGTPARPLRQHLKGLASLARLSASRSKARSEADAD